ncbi:MAG: putative restriction/modification enzyme, partial [Candidatus Rokubacteria bacterium]|nr:putative restriction/modification enzyme [Candidatus Rokubacteria bacterium]
QRTVIGCVMPRVGMGHTMPLMFPGLDTPVVGCLSANLACLSFDYTARQKVGGTHLTYGYLKQLPVLAPGGYAADPAWQRGTSLRDWLLPRVLELTYTTWDLQPFAEDCGDSGPPFIWNSARRFQLRCELDAAFFHLYGISRDDADYILDTFPIVKDRDERAHGEYRTKRVVLEIYDALAEAAATGRPYVSPLGLPRRAT